MFIFSSISIVIYKSFLTFYLESEILKIPKIDFRLNIFIYFDGGRFTYLIRCLHFQTKASIVWTVSLAHLKCAASTLSAQHLGKCSVVIKYLLQQFYWTKWAILLLICIQLCIFVISNIKKDQNIIFRDHLKMCWQCSGSLEFNYALLLVVGYV